MSKIQFFLIMLTFLGLSFSAKAQVNESTAKTVGQNFLKSKGVNSELKLAHSTAEYFVFNGENGFVIVSASNNVTPILGYSTEGSFDVTNLSPAAKEILDGYSKEIAYVISKQIEVKQVQVQWENLSNGIAPKVQKANSVAPLLGEMKWGQGDVTTNGLWYNDSCPEDANGKRAVAGCNATMMAMIIKYYNTKLQITGEHKYSATYSGQQYGELYANFGGTAYNWNLMPDVLSASSSSAEVSAVAQLIYHCGVSVNMKYGPTVSTSRGFIDNVYKNQSDGTNTYMCVRFALEDFWGFDEVAQIERKDFSYNDWISAIKEELDKGHPINYGSSNHSYICDGYDSENRLHLNFGWAGYGNGYFCVSDTSVIKAAGNNLTNGQYAMINLKSKNQTGIAAVKPTASVKVYPNPTNGQLRIMNYELREDAVIEIYDVLGQKLQSKIVNLQSKIVIDISPLASGIYFLKVDNQVIKFIKE